jgi:hypothetical protein
MGTPSCRRWSWLCVVLTVFLTWGVSSLLAAPQERRRQPTRRRLPPATIDPAQPENKPNRPPSRDSGRFDWEGMVGGILGGMSGGGVRPDRFPSGPQYMRPNRPQYVPPMRPQYGQPTYPQQVIPQPGVTIPGNVIVQPQPNEVIQRIPEQSSPLAGRVWDVSVREARCYSKELRGMIQNHLASVIDDVGKGERDMASIRTAIDELQKLLEHDAPWPEIEPVLRSFLEENQASFSDAMMQRMQLVLQLVLIRDGFLMAGHAAPRGRGASMFIPEIPTGVIWIVYDPTLAPGTGLMVGERLMVCGGGEGELMIVQTSAAEGLGLPVAPGDPLPDITPEEAETLGEFIVIRNRSDAANAVNYVLNRRLTYTAEPGYKQRIPADQDWIIEFDRGDGSAAARYSLSKGFYEFRVMEDRWELVKLDFKITIDNRDGVQDFSYLMNNEVVTVKAGESKMHESSEPVIVEFDRGEGAENAARKNLNKNGTYKVAVDTQTNYLDLFTSEDTS